MNALRELVRVVVEVLRVEPGVAMNIDEHIDLWSPLPPGEG